MAVLSSAPKTWMHGQPFCHRSYPKIPRAIDGISSGPVRRSWGVVQLPLLSHSHDRRMHLAMASSEVPDYLPATWVDSREKRPIGPRLDLTVEETIQCQLDALKYNNEPHQDHGVEVMYRFASFDPFERSKYFGPVFDLGQFERFRRIFHHSAYRVVLSHKERKILSSLYVRENCFKQRVWTRGSRPEEEEIFEFTMVQRIGGFWDGYWLTESLRHDGKGVAKGIAY